MESYTPRAPAVNERAADYLDYDDLLSLGVDHDEATTILRLSALTGHGMRPVIEAGHLAELLDGRGA
jgi:hypothetical protein